MGGRKLDDFKKLGDKLKVVLCSYEELLAPIYLV